MCSEGDLYVLLLRSHLIFKNLVMGVFILCIILSISCFICSTFGTFVFSCKGTFDLNGTCQ